MSNKMNNLETIFLFPQRDVGWHAFARVMTRDFPESPVYSYDLSPGGQMVLRPVKACSEKTAQKMVPVRSPEEVLKGHKGILAVPMFATFRSDEIVPSGLELISHLRDVEKNFDFSVLFLVVDNFFSEKGKLKFSVPRFFEKIITYTDELNSLDDLNLPLRATLYAELLFGYKYLSSEYNFRLGKPINICNILGDKLSSKEIIFKRLEVMHKSLVAIHSIFNFRSGDRQGGYESGLKNVREDFYASFYNPYIWSDGESDRILKGDLIKSLRSTDAWLHSTRNQTEIDGHHVQAQLFRPPMPFLLWRFFQVYCEVVEFYFEKTPKNYLPMFLVDNRDFSSDAEQSKDKVFHINKIFKRYFLRDESNLIEEKAENGSVSGFDVVMKGVKKSDTSIGKMPNKENNFVLEDGCFESSFIEISKDKINKSAAFLPKKDSFSSHSINQAGLFRKTDGHGEDIKISFSDYLVVFLDFFLSENKLFVAHDFIREYNSHKLETNCFQTDWFFIVSSAHRDVLEYANAGSLSSFSATTRVDFGDNPLLKNRKIIFLYKLLQFLQSRIHRVSHSWKEIEKKYISLGTENKCRECRECVSNGSKIGWRQCLENGLEITRQFLLACADEKSSFSTGLLHKKYVIAQRLENILRDFLLRPKADWSMVQLQIDYMKDRFADENLEFTCSYIKAELVDRSEVY